MPMTESDMRLVPLFCPSCGRYIASTASHSLVFELPTGSMFCHTGYARFNCLCGALSQTRESRKTGRLYLQEVRTSSWAHWDWFGDVVRYGFAGSGRPRR